MLDYSSPTLEYQQPVQVPRLNLYKGNQANYRDPRPVFNPRQGDAGIQEPEVAIVLPGGPAEEEHEQGVANSGQEPYHADDQRQEGGQHPAQLAHYADAEAGESEEVRGGGDDYQEPAEPPAQDEGEPRSDQIDAYQQFVSDRRAEITTANPSQHTIHTKQYYQPGYRKFMDNTILGSSNKIHLKTKKQGGVTKRHPYQAGMNTIPPQKLFGDWLAQWDRVYKRWFYFNKRTSKISLFNKPVLLLLFLEQSTWTKPVQFKPAQIKPLPWQKGVQGVVICLDIFLHILIFRSPASSQVFSNLFHKLESLMKNLPILLPEHSTCFSVANLTVKFPLPACRIAIKHKTNTKLHFKSDQPKPPWDQGQYAGRMQRRQQPQQPPPQNNHLLQRL